MSVTAGTYKGNGVIRSSAELGTVEPKGGTSLVEVIWTATKSVATWIEKKSRQARNRRLDAYLSRSTDHTDLARRVCGMERNNQPNWSNHAAY